ncbi:aldo/keto reductase, partial [Pyxidicoccus sp. 3LG]
MRYAGGHDSDSRRPGPRGLPLGLGLAALGRPGYITLGHGADLGEDRSTSALEGRAHAVLDAAYAAGIRYFDAARSYGRAEAFLASWLAARSLRPGEVTVGSKWGYTYTAGWQVQAEHHEVKDHSLSTFQRQLEESRALLGPHLALYQIHSATFESGVLEDSAVLSALARLREQRVLVGLSLSGASQAEVLRRALEVRVDGVPLFSCVQATWNLLERSAGPALAEAHAAGWGVIGQGGRGQRAATPSRDTGPELASLREP